jgi:galactose mutarotase-like enzyme
VLAAYDWEAPVPASRSVSYGTTLLDWTSEYRGGWQELFPNAGLECVVDEVPLPFHGEASMSKWDVAAAGATHATLRVGARLPLVLERRMSLDPDAPVLRLEERVTNHGGAPAPFIWGHHPAFEATAGMRIDLPPGPIYRWESPGEMAGQWPRLTDGGEDLSIVGPGPVERLMYLPDRGAGSAALRDPKRGRGVALAWDRTAFPHAWLWQQIGGGGFPWYGRARIVAIEPQSSWPADGLAEAAGRGRAQVLGPGESCGSWLTIALFAADERPVTRVARDGTVER